MTGCQQIGDLLDLYLDGALSEEARARVERHLLRCAACAYEARSLEQTRSLLRETFPGEQPSATFRERMNARLQNAFQDVLRPEPAELPGQRALPLNFPGGWKG